MLPPSPTPKRALSYTCTCDHLASGQAFSDRLISLKGYSLKYNFKKVKKKKKFLLQVFNQDL